MERAKNTDKDSLTKHAKPNLEIHPIKEAAIMPHIVLQVPVRVIPGFRVETRRTQIAHTHVRFQPLPAHVPL